MSAAKVKTVSLKTKPAMAAIKLVANTVTVSLTGTGSDRWDSGDGNGSVERSFTVTVTDKGVQS